jgi:hypothetical protein
MGVLYVQAKNLHVTIHIPFGSVVTFKVEASA